ncbi:MAG: DUF2914 domain-containing protein [bacterium]
MYKVPIFLLVLLLTLISGTSVAAQEEQLAQEQVEVEETKLTVETKLGTAVEERELIGEASTFPPSVGKVYCWTFVSGAEEPREITHVWYYGVEKMAEVVLPVKYPGYRTWSYKTILPEWKGRWSVEILDEAGNKLDSIALEIAEIIEETTE